MITTNKSPCGLTYRILSLLDTKSALRMSFLSKEFEGAWSLSSVIDLDQGDSKYDDKNDPNFINFLERYLEFRLKEDRSQVLEKFRLHVRCGGELGTSAMDIVGNWLDFVVMRSVKELDISLRSWPSYYSISLTNLNGKSIKALNLEYVPVYLAASIQLSLPSLKSVSLKTVRMESSVLLRLITVSFHGASITNGMLST